MALGNGAYVLHKLLEQRIGGYQVIPYNPWLTLMPFLLPRFVAEKNAVLTHTAATYAAFFSEPSLPMIITFHNYMLDHWMQAYCTPMQRIQHKYIQRRLTRRAIEKAKCITAVSGYIANLVKKDMQIDIPIKVIYNGVDTTRFTPKLKSTDWHHEVRIFFSGNLTCRKGSQWLPAISKRLNKGCRIYYTQGLRTRQKLPLGEKLESVGGIKFEKMPQCYQEMDILLMPTVREGFGLSIAEAMACGLPVVASKCSAVPELVDHGCGGFLCPVGDVDAFAEKLNLLAESPKLRWEMGEYNRAQVEKKFTLDRMVNEYQMLFNQIILQSD
jgi:glycosyltransferase involved in cell wall biosynthesis